MFLDKFRSSKLFWVLAISAFSLWFFVVVSVVSGLISLPITAFTNSEDLINVVISVVLPVMMLAGSVLMYKLFFLKYERGLKLKESLKGLGFRRPKKNVWWLVPVTIVVYVALISFASAVLFSLFPEVAKQEQEVQQVIEAMRGGYLILMVVAVGFITPIAEETFFRGLLIKLFGKRLKIPGAIIAPAALFGLAHLQINVSIDTFLFGITLGYLTYKTESIYPAIFLHMLKNCLVLSVLLIK